MNYKKLMPKFYSAKQFCKQIHIKNSFLNIIFFISVRVKTNFENQRAKRFLRLPQVSKLLVKFLNFFLFLQPSSGKCPWGQDVFLSLHDWSKNELIKLLRNRVSWGLLKCEEHSRRQGLVP